jgi:hypothetical protein
MDSQDQYPVYWNAGPSSPNLTYTAAFNVEPTHHNQAFSKASRRKSLLQFSGADPNIPLSFELI